MERTEQEQEIEVVYPVEEPLLTQVCLQAAKMNAAFDWLLRRDAESIQVFSKGRGNQFVAARTKDSNELVGLIGFFDGYKDPFIVHLRDFRKVYGYWSGLLKFLLYKSFVLILFCSYGKYYYCHDWVSKNYRKAKTVNALGLYSGIWHSMAVAADGATYGKPLLADVRKTKPHIIKLLQFHGFRPIKWSLMGTILGFLGYTRLISYKNRKHKSAESR